MKIGLLFDDRGLTDIDLRYPEKGNPGVGGTQFCFAMLSRYLNKAYPQIEIFCYHYNNNIFPLTIRNKIIDNLESAIKTVKKDDIDIFIFANNTKYKIYELIDKYEIKSVVWAHNYLFSKQIKLICNSKYLRRVVFVGRQQYDCYIDHPIIEKSQYIFNMFNSNIKFYTRKVPYQNVVTYTGSLIKAKGFHILAKQWTKIIKKVPDAILYVIGSGKLYDRNIKLGKYNIADENYERKFMKYLIDKNGKIISSVKFLGVVGQEKIKVYQKTAVGVMNPSARTETFGISAVEMEACGIPIVTKNKNGLSDTIKNGQTGVLFRFDNELAKTVVKLLKNKNLNYKLGENAQRFVKEEFCPESIIQQWYKMFDDILSDIPIKYCRPVDNYLNNAKFIKIINRKIKSLYMFHKMPSIIDYECCVRNLIMKLKS